MKKRMVVLLLVMIMISGLCVNAMATERASQIKPKLSFSGKTANCSVTVVEAGKLDATSMIVLSVLAVLPFIEFPPEFQFSVIVVSRVYLKSQK